MIDSIRKIVDLANVNTTMFPSFNFAEATGDNQSRRRINNRRTELIATEWLDGVPHCGLSVEGTPIIYSLPNAIDHYTENQVYDSLIKMAPNVALEVGGGADNIGRNNQDSYQVRDGEIAGNVKLVSIWHAIGQNNSEPVISTGFIKSSSQFVAATKMMYETQDFSRIVNAIIETIDPTQYKALQALRDAAKLDFPHLTALNAIDPLLVEGRAIQFNRQTSLHHDRQDPLRAWATMITFGRFSTGGDLIVPRLNLRIRYLPGDAIILRGRILPHEVTKWGPGQRISIAHFTHESLWAMYGIKCP